MADIQNIVPDVDTGQTSATKLNESILESNKVRNGTLSRTGTTLSFDSIFGAIYNAASPSNSNTITLSPTGAIVGAVCAFHNDGSVEPNVSPTPVPVGGSWVSGQLNIYYFMWNGTNYEQNILTAVPLPQLTKPTFTLASGASSLSLDYSLVVTDSNSTSGVMEISNDQATWYAVTSGEYTFGDTSGTINAINSAPLVGGTTYYVRLKTSAPSYQDSDYATESAAASSQPTLTAPTIVVTAGDTQNSIDRTVEDVNATGGVLEFSLDEAAWNPVPGFVFGTNPTVHTGLTNGTEYFYRYKSTANGYTDSVYGTDSATPQAGISILFQDDFSGTTIDSSKWDFTDTDGALTQNNELIFNAIGSATTPWDTTDNSIISKTSFSNNILVLKFTISDTSNITGGTSTIGIGLNDTLDIVLKNNTLAMVYNPPNVITDSVAYAWDGGSASNHVIESPFADGDYKLVINKSSGTLDGYYWNGSAWVQASSGLSGLTYSGVDFKIVVSVSRNNPVSGTGDIRVDDMYLTNADFNTQNPI